MRHVLVLALLLLVPFSAGAQKKGKKKEVPPERKLAERIEKARNRLGEVAVPDPAARPLEEAAKQYLGAAERRLAAGELPAAEGLTQAGDALTRAVDHMRHSRDVTRKDYPDRAGQAAHLERAYFRLQQADYFQAQSKDPRTKALLRAARQFYQQARQAYDRQEARYADEYTKVSEEIVKALEHLAHTATPVREPPRLK